ncbi:MAG: ABC transporter ATP-binding protein [Candidatus Omnitrophica bacterium]|nr:ABC transporter ATP-binding protein [Candidatus Omnitrophota bacterium]
MLVKAEGLSKKYETGGTDLEAVKGASLAIDKAEILALLGPSGAGKSTLLHMLGGLDRPSSGKVFFDGIDLYGISDSRRSRLRNSRIGFVFQLYHLLGELTSMENVTLPAMLACGNKLAKKDIMARGEYLLESVGVIDRAFHKPCQLSGGEAQRVSIARALMNNPDIVLCDEPTGNLDSENAYNILKIIQFLNTQFNQAFLIVTHNERISDLADRVIYMEDGKLK